MSNCEFSRWNNTQKVVAKLGGEARIAKVLNIHPEAVHYWKRTNKIPPASAIRLYFYARENHIPVALEDLCHHMRIPTVERAKEESVVLAKREDDFEPVELGA